MAVTAFTFEPDLREAFLSLPYALYRDDPRWIPPSRREAAAMLAPPFPFYARPGNHHRHFLASAAGRTVGRVTAFVNRDLRDADGGAVGGLGFFECADPASAGDLLETALDWLGGEHRLPRVWGPIQFDIWHGYRFRMRGQDRAPFLGEPYHRPEYPELFEQAGFRVRRRWRSYELTGEALMEAAAARGLSRWARLEEVGYRFAPLGPRDLPRALPGLHRALTTSFRGFLAFTPIALDEFAERLAAAGPALAAAGSGLVFDAEGRLAGFILSFLDVADALRAMGGRRGLVARLRFLRGRRRAGRVVVHSGGLMPEEAARRTGLARAVFSHAVHALAAAGWDRLVFPLVAEDNPVRGLYAPYAEAGREYALYERTL